MTTTGRDRLWWVDLLKALAAPLILLHHLAFYGPMSDHARELAPALIDWLFSNARLAVQVFLVVAGFLAARQLAPGGGVAPGLNPLVLLRERWLRLLPAYAATLGLALLSAAVARHWMDHRATPTAPDLPQVLAHLLMLQDLLGLEALSAGIWYLAIDLQLFALLALLLWACDRVPPVSGRAADRSARRAAVTVALVALASALHFNLQPGGDIAAPYFFAAYGAGVLAAWAPRRGRPAVVWWSLALAAAALSLHWAWRDRLALALAVALALAWLGHRPAPAACPAWLRQGVTRLSTLSYALFLVHYPVCLFVNAAFERFVPHAPALQALGLLVAVVLSLLAAVALHRWLEVPAARWLAARRHRAAAPALGMG
ncbi:acyltransferase family protein [Aquabacterium sp. J223]|uniref:acyltransferase family protein n=1 Tax=Aquabacterium sp. J223 TaxID=2898431 RepID=UPI0021AD9307|nr:acyltransferase family protein [Aquabacterium sp. J223]UUX93973.1 acyltransferase family protein [Aquabacterium sp. J223]